MGEVDARRRILCFGDSNTHGYIPMGGRYGEDVRWPTRMASLLGDGFAVVEEGVNGRTCVFDDPVSGGFRSGADALPVCLMSHDPLDVVLLMLGTNDTKARFNMSAPAIARAMMQLVNISRQYAVDADGQPSHVVIVAPPPIDENHLNRSDRDIFGDRAAEVSRGLAREYRVLSKLLRCHFMDAGLYAQASPRDGIHLDEEGHARLAQAMADLVRKIVQ